MSGSLTSILINEAWMKVVRVLYGTSRPLTVREIIDLSGLSVGGTQDVLRRLSKFKIVERKKKGRNVFYELCLSDDETKLLKTIFDLASKSFIAKRAQVLSKRFEVSVGWIDQTISDIERLKDANS